MFRFRWGESSSEDIRMSEKVERRTENGGGAGTGGGGAGGGDGGGGAGGGGRGAGDNNCHEVGAFSVPLISKVRESEFSLFLNIGRVGGKAW